MIRRSWTPVRSVTGVAKRSEAPSVPDVGVARRGVIEAIYQAYVPGKADYGAEMAELQRADIAVLFIGGYHTEIALIARAARDRGYPVQLVSGVGLTTEDLASLPAPRPKERSSLIPQTRADAPKRRRS